MIKRIFIPVILILLFALSFTACSGSNPVSAKVKEHIELANKYLQEGKYEEAILAFQKVIEVEPKNIPARIGLGKAYNATKVYDKAENILKEALGIDNKNIEARVELSETYILSGKNGEAEKVLKEAMDINPKAVSPYIKLARLYLNLSRANDAIEILKKGYSATNDSEIKKMLDDLAAISSKKIVQDKETRLIDFLPDKTNGEYGVKYTSRDDKGKYIDLTRIESKIGKGSKDYYGNVSNSYHYLPAFNYVGVQDEWISGTPAGVKGSGFKRDLLLSVTLNGDFKKVHVTGKADSKERELTKDRGCIIRFYIYKGENNYNNPIWQAQDKGTFDFVIDYKDGENLYFGVDAGEEDWEDWAHWREIRFKGVRE